MDPFELEGGFVKGENETKAPTRRTRSSRKRAAASSEDDIGSNGGVQNDAPIVKSRTRQKTNSSRQPITPQRPSASATIPTPSRSSHSSRASSTSADSELKSAKKKGVRKSVKKSSNEMVSRLSESDSELTPVSSFSEDEDSDIYEEPEDSDTDVEELVVTKISSDESDIEKNKEEETKPTKSKAKTKRKPRKKADDVDPSRPKYLQYFDRSNKALLATHPYLETIFEDLENSPSIQVEKASQPEELTIKLLPFQLEGLNWLIRQEQGIYGGGILADEMGMGKTIQTIALILADAKDSGPTLVVAPTVALIQWRNEIEQHTEGKLTSCVYYGQNRTTKAEELTQYNVVLTTYAVLESVYRKQQSGFKRKDGVYKEKSLLHSIVFHRVVLDEAHNIKDRTTNTARAVFSLKAKHRLCLSGTPLQNRIGELFSLIKFLKVEPFCQYFCKKCECAEHTWQFTDYKSCDVCGHRVTDHLNFFNHSLLKHIQRQGTNREGGESMKKMRILMKKIMLRRTKLERADDLGLPPRVVEIRRDFFNEEEKDLYSSIYSDSNRKFNTYVEQRVVLNNYANIFTLITRMRQIADHPDLVLRRHVEDPLQPDNSLVCKICDDEAEDAIRSKCHHTFCRMCIKEYCEGWTGNQNDLECPVCHIGLTIDLSAPAIVVDEEVVKKGSIINRINMTGGWRSSTKIEALVEELYKLRSDRRTIKSIVFSQFTSMLDLVEWRLKRAGFETVKLQGSMSPTQRDNIIRYFMDTPSVEVFLVSLKAGGVALNLCEASHVFILDPWWNPSVEWQSGDRVHRIGQHRPVKITRLVIEDSIEARIIELQDKKADMIHATIGQDDSAMNRLTPDDMAFLFTN